MKGMNDYILPGVVSNMIAFSMPIRWKKENKNDECHMMVENCTRQIN